MLTESEQACRQLQDELYQAQEQHRRSGELLDTQSRIDEKGRFLFLF